MNKTIVVLCVTGLLVGGCSQLNLGPPPLRQRDVNDPLPEKATPAARGVASSESAAEGGGVSAAGMKRGTAVAEARSQWLETQRSVAQDDESDVPVQVLVVNGETITAEEVARDVAVALGTAAYGLPASELRMRVEQEIIRHVRDHLAEVLLYQQASRRITERERKHAESLADREIRQLAALQYDGVMRRLELDLKVRGVTLEQMRTRLTRSWIIRRYFEEQVRPRISEPTRAELLSIFEKNRAQWGRPERRAMSLIDVRIENFREVDGRSMEDADARRAARQYAQQVLNEIHAGLDFAEAARKYSHDIHAADGGDWGFVMPESVRERLLPAVQALAHLSSGEISEVIETPSSFFIVRCTRLEPGFVPTFESVQRELQDQHFQETYNRLVALEVEKLRLQATIVPVNLDRFAAGVLGALPATPDAAARGR